MVQELARLRENAPEKRDESNKLSLVDLVKLDDLPRLRAASHAADDKVTQLFGQVHIDDHKDTLLFRDAGGNDPVTDKEKKSMPGGQLPDAAFVQAQKAAEAYGCEVSTKTVNGETVYCFYVTQDGERKEILTTSDKNYARELEKWQQEKIEFLEKTFNVNISENGETGVAYPDKPVELRTPSVDELIALERALYKSQPSNLSQDGRLQINFHKERQGGNAAYYWTPDGKPCINVEPYVDGVDVDSATEILTHEMAHNGDHTLESMSDELEEKINNQMGWVKGPDNQWFFQSKDNELYMHTKEGDWMRVDEDGHPLDANGKKSSETNAERLDCEEMRKEAKVTPVTGYFTSPQEMYAEAMTALRLGADSRAELYRISPELYWMAKAADQIEIDLFYGKIDGVSKYIRNSNGDLVENTTANWKQVEQFEQGIAASASHYKMPASFVHRNAEAEGQ